MGFILTDCYNPACYGTFPSLEAAQKQAATLESSGLCQSYSVGTHIGGKFVEVYNSNDSPMKPIVDAICSLCELTAVRVDVGTRPTQLKGEWWRLGISPYKMCSLFFEDMTVVVSSALSIPLADVIEHDKSCETISLADPDAINLITKAVQAIRDVRLATDARLKDKGWKILE